jgi:hypothetical protein
VHRFLNDYAKKGYAEQLPEKVFDHNQVFSSHGLQIAAHSAQLTTLLLRACSTGESFRETIETTSDELSPATYLFQLGVLTLQNAGEKYDADGKFDLVVPNWSVRRNYAKMYLKAHIGQDGSASAFLHDPTVTSLEEMLEPLMAAKKWGKKQTEADLQSLLVATLILDSTGDISAERTYPKAKPGRGRPDSVDCHVETPNHVILIELKTVRGGLLTDETLELDADAYSQEARDRLNALEQEEFLDLTVRKRGKVSNVHGDAEDQMRGYVAMEEAEQAKTNKLPVVGFAVTQVATRFHVTQVWNDDV